MNYILINTYIIIKLFKYIKNQSKNAKIYNTIYLFSIYQ